jgi:Asp-tRNA(Asn)/Glu-tRNA(Gln) amidotransferase A subunit family amidase
MYLARLKRLDEKLHCVVTLTEERALAQARLLDEELAQRKPVARPLLGLPWVAKDLLAVKGTPTTWGTTPYKDQVFDHDAAVVEKLDAAGAILIAKVSLGELAWGDVWFGGMTRNPWNLNQGSSGSSAGSASAVAAGCAVFAIGSETLGSIVSPSDRCGTSSLRPTFGRVSRYGAMTLCWSLDKLGPICRSAWDAELIFNVIEGIDARDPTTVDLPFWSSPIEVRGWKVGVPKGTFGGSDGPGCKPVLDDLKKLGVELVEIELPEYPVDEMMIVLQAEAAAAFDDFSRGDKDDQMARQERQAWPNVLRHAQLIPAVDYIRANRLRTLLIRDLEAALAGVKAIVHPSFAGSILAMTNLSGHPTFVAPCGFREDGTPFSISFTGRLFGESELLAIAMAWQGVTDHHLKHPKL